MTLAELDVLIVDCQATGASPAFGRVLELGWGIKRAGEARLADAQAHWIELPDGYQVSAPVRRVTGYTPSLAAGAIAESKAWERLRSDMGGVPSMPTAIHYARFELPFLREWARRFEPDAPFPFDAVCVHGIATRLYPDLPRQSIRALAGYLGYSLDLTRRALGHVEATAFVWDKMCSELAARGLGTWADLQAFLAQPRVRPARSGAARKPKYPILPERYRTLPDEPGVYRFLRRNGDVLYVGKATSLRKRTASHFIGRAGTPQAPEMLTQVSDIVVAVTASPLEAALLENETIKTLRPPYNVHLTPRDTPVWYGTLAFDAAASAPDERHPLGPLPSEHSLEPLGALSALLAGAPATNALRAQAVGVSALFTPDAPVFEAGWAELVARHPLELGGARSPRRRALDFARKILSVGVASDDDDADAEPASERADANASVWDPARVARHVESAAGQAYRAYRRAHWLRLLHDSDIVLCEPGSDRTRLLTLRAGAIVDARDVREGHVPEVGVQRAHPEKRPAFDRAKYDRLRVLTTELKRIVRDGGSVAVYWGSRRFPARFLPGTLRAV